MKKVMARYMSLAERKLRSKKKYETIAEKRIKGDMKMNPRRVFRG